jgi:adenosylcobinamide-phosphate synthase
LGTPTEFAPHLPLVDPAALEPAMNETDILPGDPPSLRALQTTVGLIWRALLLWILLLLLLSVAAWLG